MAHEHQILIAFVGAWIVASCAFAWVISGWMRRAVDEDKKRRTAFKIPDDCNDQPK